ncbi:MAG: RNA polymerase sigma factor [Bacteroidetes bacterium]|nr:RNA polymerase sigma factor [Bacteroidota bacterium]
MNSQIEHRDLTDLAVAALGGNSTAMNTLLACVRPRLYAYALRICKHRTQADDAIQDAFLHAYTHIRQLRQPSAFYPWIRSIVRRSAWRELRITQGPIRSADNLQLITHPTEESLESAIEQQLAHNTIYESIGKLTDTLKLPVLLRYFSGHQEYEQIAEILSIPVGTVRSRLNEAKKQLRLAWTGGVDLPAALQQEAERWNEFYREVWSKVYDAPDARKRLTSHLANDLHIHFTSGARTRGRSVIEREIEDDMRYGSRSTPASVFNVGNIGIVECTNENSAEYPDRCPAATTFIFHRDREQTVLLQLHHASRSLEMACS